MTTAHNYILSASTCHKTYLQIGPATKQANHWMGTFQDCPPGNSQTAIPTPKKAMERTEKRK